MGWQTKVPEKKIAESKVLLINLKEQGPVPIGHAAFAILKPAIIFARHDDTLDISLSFNLQTSTRSFDEALVSPANFFHSGIAIMLNPRP